MSCCSARVLEADARFAPVVSGVSERVMRCRSCGALWVEEWHVRVGYGGADDRDVFQHRRISLDEAEARFGTGK